ncbi:hypothetical protein [uncultured Thermanaerothrix sp.]|uniref:hypothetical protein n=1 Tax=uncultured Thermanaerothrix sp. TaxID=1195149 RepID=UPI00260AF351|nr:hypothetical protein [uncultured Thermanaerothrix sp.]
MRRSNLWIYGSLFLALAVLISLLVFLNYRLVQYQRQTGSDFFVGWQSMRLLLQEGVSPYANTTAQRIGRMGVEVGLDVSWVPFNAPLYALILYLPFAIVKDFTLARALALSVAEISIGLALYLSLQATTWRPRAWVWGVLALFGIGWFPGAMALLGGSVIPAVVLFVSLGLWAVRTRHEEIAGVALGLAMVRPHVVGILIVVILLWALFTRRNLILLWFLITVVLLSLFFALFLPSWPLEYLAMLVNRQRPLVGLTVGEALRVFFPGIGTRLGLAISAMMGAVLLVELMLHRRGGLRAFVWLASLSLVVTPWTGIRLRPEDLSLFLPAIVLVGSLWIERWQRVGLILFGVIGVMLGIGAWGMAGWRIMERLPPQNLALLILLIPLMGIALLYWVRWWAIRPPSVWMDLIRQEDIEPSLEE